MTNGRAKSQEGDLRIGDLRMKKKPGLFSLENRKNYRPEDKVPWDQVFNELTMLPPGEKIPVPGRRSEYIKMREEMSARNDDQAADVISFIDFIFKHEKLGNMEFPPELN